MFRIRTLQDFAFSEDGVDKGAGGEFTNQAKYGLEYCIVEDLATDVMIAGCAAS